MYFAAALLVLVGCNKKDNALNNAPEGTPFEKGQKVTLTVGTGAQQGPNRVAGVDNTAENRIDFTWEEGDQILVKVDDKTAVFTLTTGAGSADGEFTGTMPAAGSSFDIQYPIEEPALSAQEYTTDKTIPADKMLFTATNCTLFSNEISLTAQYAMVQLNLFGTDKTVGKIIFKNITADPAVSYTLTCTGGVAIGTTSAEATPFYMVVPTGTYQFEAEIWDNATTSAEICSFATSAAKTFTAGECLNMPAKYVPTYVDLGLSVKWATCNLGATTPEGYGDYFAWGETSPKDDYSLTNYFDAKYVSGWSFLKYNNEGGKTTLEPEDDAAHVNWGGNWRMPTKAEFEELHNNCTWTWTQKSGIYGCEVKGSNDKSIFLPASGLRDGSDPSGVGSEGYYWSSSLYESSSGSTYIINFLREEEGLEWYCEEGWRYYGLSVRPVCQ